MLINDAPIPPGGFPPRSVRFSTLNKLHMFYTEIQSRYRYKCYLESSHPWACSGCDWWCTVTPGVTSGHQAIIQQAIFLPR